MKATPGSNVITLDVPTMVTRRGGTLLMAIGAVLGIIFWLDKLFLHIPFLGFFNTLGIWIGAIGFVLYVFYWILKVFGYTK
jgi:hypothetical protein